MSVLSDRLLAAVDEREAVAGWPSEHRVLAAHRRIVQRYLSAVAEAQKTPVEVSTLLTTQVRAMRRARVEGKVAVLADVLDDLATAYKVT